MLYFIIFFSSLHIVDTELYYMYSKIGNGSSHHKFEPLTRTKNLVFRRVRGHAHYPWRFKLYILDKRMVMDHRMVLL